VSALAFREFNEVYQDAVRVIYSHWTPQMQTEIATHCYSWSPGSFNFKEYLQASTVRFYRAYHELAKRGDSRPVCDVGGFWGVFPITLKVLGYDVTMTESLQYYSRSFDKLFNSIADRGVKVVDYDPFKPEARLSGCFDFVVVMAVLEHYPHSHRIFLENITAMLSNEGLLYIEVPNIAYWPKRTALLRGRTPLAQIKDIYNSKVPFIGHHHEFTISELRDLVHLSGLSVIAEDFYNYSPGSLLNLHMLLHHTFQFGVFALCKDSRECLAILAKQNEKR
jgi:2-polyprenyl-3-methyl-5-hydroxy-6-metoxy-1,4-benzoquinol methylase